MRTCAACVLLALTGCASAPPPAAEMAAARAALVQAEPLGWRYAPVELRAAQAKLAAAEQAMSHEEWSRARMLAEEAEVDARYAWALADHERSRAALEKRP